MKILGKTQTRVFPITIFLANPLQKEIVITPDDITSDDIDVKIALVTKLDKRNKTTFKKN